MVGNVFVYDNCSRSSICAVSAATTQHSYFSVSPGTKSLVTCRLRRGVNVLIATPGRLIDHIQSTKCLELSRIKYLVIDEADRLDLRLFTFPCTFMDKYSNAGQCSILIITNFELAAVFPFRFSNII